MFPQEGEVIAVYEILNRSVSKMTDMNTYLPTSA